MRDLVLWFGNPQGLHHLYHRFLPLARELSSYNLKLAYVGSDENARIVREQGYQAYSIPMVSLYETAYGFDPVLNAINLFFPTGKESMLSTFRKSYVAERELLYKLKDELALVVVDQEPASTLLCYKQRKVTACKWVLLTNILPNTRFDLLTQSMTLMLSYLFKKFMSSFDLIVDNDFKPPYSLSQTLSVDEEIEGKLLFMPFYYREEKGLEKREEELIRLASNKKVLFISCTGPVRLKMIFARKTRDLYPEILKHYDLIIKTYGEPSIERSVLTSENLKLAVLPFLSRKARIELMSKASVFLSPASLGNILDCVYARVPIVAVPMQQEQKLNAKRIQELGIGAKSSFDELAEKLMEVERNRSYYYSNLCKLRSMMVSAKEVAKKLVSLV